MFDFVQSGDLFSYAITLWDQTTHERRAYFPGFSIRLQWNFPDPVLISGSPKQRLDNFREMRNHLKDKIEIWIDQIKSEKVFCLRKAS